MKTVSRHLCDKCRKDLSYRVVWRMKVKRRRLLILTDALDLELCPECGSGFWKWLQEATDDPA